MSKTPSLVPRQRDKVKLGDERFDLKYFTDEALSLIDRIKDKAELTDDDIVMLALTTAQAVLARRLYPDGGQTDEETINKLFGVLDDYRVVEATFNKIRKMVRADKRKARQPSVDEPERTLPSRRLKLSAEHGTASAVYK